MRGALRGGAQDGGKRYSSTSVAGSVSAQHSLVKGKKQAANRFPGVVQ